MAKKKMKTGPNKADVAGKKGEIPTIKISEKNLEFVRFF